MYSEILVGNKIEEGRRLIEVLEKSGLSPKTAFWYYAPKQEEWRLAMSMPLVDRIGTLKVYDKIDAIMKKVKPPLEMYIADLHLQESRSPLVKAVKGAVVHSKKPVIDRFKSICRDAGLRYVEDAYIYRI